MMSAYELTVVYFCLNLSLVTKCMIRYTWRHLALIHIVCVREVFHDNVILFTKAALLVEKWRVRKAVLTIIMHVTFKRVKIIYI